jgi:hypothetical protein
LCEEEEFLYAFLASALDGLKRSAARSGRFNLKPVCCERIENELKEAQWEGVDRIELAEELYQWLDILTTFRIPRVP